MVLGAAASLLLQQVRCSLGVSREWCCGCAKPLFPFPDLAVPGALASRAWQREGWGSAAPQEAETHLERRVGDSCSTQSPLHLPVWAEAAPGSSWRVLGER